MTYTRSIVLPVDVDEAFALITEPDRLRRWKSVTATVDLRVGGECRFTVTPGNIVEGTFREIEPGRRVVYGWGFAGNPDLQPDASTVTVVLDPVAEGTRVTLTHAGLTAEQEVGHAEGWEHYLGRLEKLVADGDAGADEWAYAPQQLDELTAAEAALAVLQGVARQLTAEDQPKQTPCTDFTCHDLVLHLFDSLVAFGGFVDLDVVRPEEGSLEHKLSTMATQVLTGWRARGTEGSVPGPGGAEMPAAYAAGIIPVELLLHTWDLSQGSGRPMVVSDEVVGYVRELAEKIIPGGRGTRFADEVVLDGQPDPLLELAAYAGRRAVSV
jgi:uncharacterized protein (TIGR03086 family)